MTEEERRQEADRLLDEMQRLLARAKKLPDGPEYEECAARFTEASEALAALVERRQRDQDQQFPESGR